MVNIDKESPLYYIISLAVHLMIILLIPVFSVVEEKKLDYTRVRVGTITKIEKTAPDNKKDKKEEIKNLEKKDQEKKIVKKKVEKKKPEKLKDKPKKVAQKKPTKPAKAKEPKKVVTSKPIETVRNVDSIFSDFDTLAVAEASRVVNSGRRPKREVVSLDKTSDLIEDREINSVDSSFNYEIEDTYEEFEAIDTEDFIAINETMEDLGEEGLEDLTTAEPEELVGAKSGLQYKSLDGESDVIWDSRNKRPVYPKEAELRGLKGTVKIVLEVDNYGRVRNVVMSKSGIPEIDRAVEKLARSWRVRLVKDGVYRSGKVQVQYEFNLKGRS